MRARVCRAARGDRQLGAYEEHVLRFAGALRQFAEDAADPAVSAQDVQPLDQAIADHSQRALELYEQGRQDVRQKVAAFDEQIKRTADPGQQSQLKMKRQGVTSYMSFDFDVAADYLRELAQR